MGDKTLNAMKTKYTVELGADGKPASYTKNRKQCKNCPPGTYLGEHTAAGQAPRRTCGRCGYTEEIK